MDSGLLPLVAGWGGGCGGQTPNKYRMSGVQGSIQINRARQGGVSWWSCFI